MDELVGKVVDLVGNERYELEAFNETLHLVLAPDLDLQLVPEQLVELVCAAARGHNLDALAHLLDRHAVEHRRAFYERLYEIDAFVYVLRLEPFKVE